MNNFLNRLEKKIGKYAIKNLVAYLIGGYVIGYIIYFINPNILSYLKANFKEVSGTPKAGDIHVTKNSKGAYHIFIELGDGKKAEANSKKKYYPHEAKTSTGKTNWIFRAK